MEDFDWNSFVKEMVEKYEKINRPDTSLEKFLARAVTTKMKRLLGDLTDVNEILGGINF